MMTRTVLSAAAPALSHPSAPDSAPCRFSRVTGRGSQLAEFLIANPRLTFCVNHRKASPLKVSNRKYSAIFPTQGREFIPSVSASGHSPEPLAPLYPLPTILSSFEPQASSLSEPNRDTAIRNRNKPHPFSHFQFSNRDKTGCLRPECICGNRFFE